MNEQDEVVGIESRERIHTEGLGLLPIKMIPHYKKEYETELDDVGAGLEEVFLPEYAQKVFYK